MKFNPITLLFIIIFSIYFLCGCQTKIGKAVDNFFAQEPPTWQQVMERHEFRYGGRPRGIWLSEPRPFEWSEYRRDPEKRGFSSW